MNKKKMINPQTRKEFNQWGRLITYFCWKEDMKDALRKSGQTRRLETVEAFHAFYNHPLDEGLDRKAVEKGTSPKDEAWAVMHGPPGLTEPHSQAAMHNLIKFQKEIVKKEWEALQLIEEQEAMSLHRMTVEQHPGEDVPAPMQCFRCRVWGTSGSVCQKCEEQISFVGQPTQEDLDQLPDFKDEDELDHPPPVGSIAESDWSLVLPNSASACPDAGVVSQPHQSGTQGQASMEVDQSSPKPTTTEDVLMAKDGDAGSPEA